jgi:membrane carboxypeptidase/penicillin-binding protein
MPHTDAMRTENYENAKQAELEIIPLKADATDAPYLVDFIREELMKDYSEEKLMTNGLGGYTTLDPEFQKAAVRPFEKNLTFGRGPIRRARSRTRKIRGIQPGLA